MINVKKMDDSQRLVGILNGYLSKFTSKDKKEKQKDVHEDVKQEIIYVDNESQKKVISPVYMNYLKVIKSFDSFNDVGIFLDSLRYNEDLIPTIEKMINLLSDTKEDELLKSYLETYVINMTNNSANNDNDVLKDEVKDDVLIMYYDFYEGKNRVLSDIKGKISPEYYEDVLRAINQIKKNGGIGKRKRLDCVKKAFRIRVNDIRVTYRQTSEKVYVILGVFCKKDNKGYDIINTSSKRNSDFNLKEPFIDKMLKIKEGKQMINDKNKKFEQDIISLLNSKVNNKKGK